LLTTLENLENSGNLLILENAGNFKFTQGIFVSVIDRGHQVLCIIVSNISIDWLGGTVTGVGGAQ